MIQSDRVKTGVSRDEQYHGKACIEGLGRGGREREGVRVSVKRS